MNKCISKNTIKHNIVKQSNVSFFCLKKSAFICIAVFPHASWIRWCHLFSDALGQQGGYRYAIGCSLIQYNAAANHD